MKRKAYLELGITLIVGFLIGFFVNSIVTHKRIQSYTPHHGEMGFWKRSLQEVGATEGQKQAIFPIIRNHKKEAREILQQSWKEVAPIWKDMESEIMNELSTEQQLKMKELMDKRQHHKRHMMNKGERGKHKHQKQHRPHGHKPPHQQ